MEMLTLDGINGQHLLGFLSALGSLSLLDKYAREKTLEAPRLAFHVDGTAVVNSPVAKGQLPTIMLKELLELQPYLDVKLATVKKPTDFTRSSFHECATHASEPCELGFLAGLACVVGDEVFESTLCAANGASHQNLVQAMRDVLSLLEDEHLRLALFSPWRRAYRVPDDKRKQLQLGTRKPTLRLEPSDERLYALRLSNPTTTDDYSTELGAQALAMPAFSLLPVVPSKRPVSVASKRHGQRVTFSWPLWNVPATLHTVRSLLWEGAGLPKGQRERGVFASFSADRVSGSKGKLSFSPSQGVW